MSTCSLFVTTEPLKKIQRKIILSLFERALFAHYLFTDFESFQSCNVLHYMESSINPGFFPKGDGSYRNTKLSYL